MGNIVDSCAGNHSIPHNFFFAVIFEEHLLSTTPFDIICYGIGSVQKSKNAQYQFVLALILRELLKVKNYI